MIPKKLRKPQLKVQEAGGPDKMRSIRRRCGDVFRVPLGGKYFAYGRVLEDPLFEFYSRFETKEATPSDMRILPVAFRIWVAPFAITTGRWPIIGHVSLRERPVPPQKFFIKDPITGKLSIYSLPKPIPATPAQCRDLEAAAGWDPEHVEDRLRDLQAGRPNVWYESMKA